jgi:hypothetical protein
MSAGISPGLVRMSVGFTGSLEQRWEQLAKAFLAVRDAAQPDEAAPTAGPVGSKA